MDLASQFNNEWFQNKEWWFNCSAEIDNYIIEKYIDLLDYDISRCTFICKILIYDQLPRHIYRNTSSHHIVEYYLQKAIQCCIQNIQNIQNIDNNKLTDEEFCFALLPLRHSNITHYVYWAIDICWNRLKKQNNNDLLKRFLIASYQRCPLIGAVYTRGLGTYLEKYRDILDYSPSYPPINNKHKITKFTKMEKPNIKSVIISLSGGVDSMVCSWLLVNTYPKSNITAIHINYNNRSTSDMEASFVVDWCTFLGIKCKVRRIHEIERKSCMDYGMREVYERYTRNIRYFCYKEEDADYIVLGHNRDDVLENIFTNIAHKHKYDNLDGMQEHSIQDGISFWRPLLKKTKQQIKDFANELGIPYLPNSTPVWSQRGQIRDTIVPTLQNWNISFIESMYHLSDTVRDLYNILDLQIETFLKDTVCESKNRKITYTTKYATLPVTYLFWKGVFKKLDIHITDKSLQHFISRISNDNVNDSIKITISKVANCVIKPKLQTIYVELFF
jgi:tRNA(Ile)-lysidine synthetase-like protein